MAASEIVHSRHERCPVAASCMCCNIHSVSCAVPLSDLVCFVSSGKPACVCMPCFLSIACGSSSPDHLKRLQLVESSAVSCRVYAATVTTIECFAGCETKREAMAHSLDSDVSSGGCAAGPGILEAARIVMLMHMQSKSYVARQIPLPLQAIGRLADKAM